jgi:hypothetical protein
MITKKCLSGEELVLAANQMISDVEKSGELSSLSIVLLIYHPHTRGLGLKKLLSSSTEIAREVFENLPIGSFFEIICARQDAIEILKKLAKQIADLYEVPEVLLAKVKTVDWGHADLIFLKESRNIKLREWAANQFLKLEASKDEQNETLVFNEQVLATSKIWFYSNMNSIKSLTVNGKELSIEGALRSFLISDNISHESKQKLIAKFGNMKDQNLLLILLSFLPEDDKRRKKLWNKLFSMTRSWLGRILDDEGVLCNRWIGEAVKTQSELNRVLKYVSYFRYGMHYFFSTFISDATKPEFREQVIRMAFRERAGLLIENCYVLTESDIPVLADLSPDLVAMYHQSQLHMLLV